MKRDMPAGKSSIVIDFAENYTHESRFEHQSKHFCQVARTILPIVLRFRIEDLTTISDERRAELLSFCESQDVPKIIVETHFIISNDMQHDNAFVRKVSRSLMHSYSDCLGSSALLVLLCLACREICYRRTSTCS